MTEDERREAERLAQEYVDYCWKDGVKAVAHLAYCKGYAAACEAKRQEYGRDIGSEAFDDTVKALETERDFSASLIEAIKALRDGHHEKIGENMDKLFLTIRDCE